MGWSEISLMHTPIFRGFSAKQKNKKQKTSLHLLNTEHSEPPLIKSVRVPQITHPHRDEPYGKSVLRCRREGKCPKVDILVVEDVLDLDKLSGPVNVTFL